VPNLSSPLVSVIVPVYNAGPTIRETMDALAQQDTAEQFEIIVADNGSSDDSLAIVQSLLKSMANLRIVDASSQPGAAHARNVAASHAEGQVLAFCDADDRPAPGWLRNLFAVSQGRHAVGGRLNYSEINEPGAAQRMTFQAHGLPRLMAYLPWTSTANLMVPAAAFKRVGGFDRRFEGAGGEDVDFSWKLQEAGVSLRFAPEAVVHYRVRTRIKSQLGRLYHYAINDPLVYRLHRHAGARRRSLRGVIWGWLRVLVTLPTCVVPRYRYRWLRRVASQLGWLVGSFRHRVIYL
jgi:glycosyltransferase involved in cell wall biosynthesis